ncbi:MDR family MFS transporter [Hyalangium minutum]|uniref:Drug resistance transporter EmrB/QacA subfamily protein n=1 Tax=Hyalangium minutum TaxID=394096 RepID=A0A085WLB0_9BACT|nr:MDR family MFS transporter [Hyalangium minutum]KFE68473.1 Drug resistance transporter EmrB/QacA subfamily protein [Hyalangium minutum]
MAPPNDAPFTFSRSEKVFTLLGALLGMLLAALDQTIVATAGPAIQDDLSIPASLYSWITTSYLVASTVMVPLWGKMSDQFGRRKILVTGILVFLAGSFLCGAAWGTVPLILFRAVQGLGSAALFTSAFAVVADLFPPAERGKYQGLFGGVFGLSSVVGPLVGGFITDTFGWHWVFFINLPVGVVALAVIFLRMPALRRPRTAPPKWDLAGVACLVVAVVPLLLALSLGRSHTAPGEAGFSWGSWQVLGLFAVSLVGAVLFVLVEAQADEPLLDLRLFQEKTFALGNATVFVIGAVFLSAFTFLPLFMVNVVGLSATRSGLTIMPLTLGVVAGNVLSGQLASRLGRYKVLMLGALVLLCVGFAVMGFTLSPDSTQATVTAKMVLMGLGMGPTIPLYTLAIQNAVPPRQIGVATSTTTFFRQLGSTVGVALAGVVFASALSHPMQTRTEQEASGTPAEVRSHLGVGMPGVSGEGGEAPVASQGLRMDRATKEAFTQATSSVYRVAIWVTLVALVLTALLPERPLRRGPMPPPPME